MNLSESISYPLHKKAGESFDLYQLQIEGLKEGWFIYPKALNPLALTIKKKGQRRIAT